VRLYKAKGGPTYDWANPEIMQQWRDYAALDVYIPILLYYSQQGERDIPALGSVAACRKQRWGRLTTPLTSEPAPGGNRHKKDWNHVYRAILQLISKDHPGRSTFAYLWSSHHMTKDPASIQAEEARLRKSGRHTEAEISQWKHSSTKGRTRQFVPRPKELLAEFDALMDLYGKYPDFQLKSGKVVPWTTNPSKLKTLLAKYRADIIRDRFSDPEGVPMYSEMADGFFMSARGTCKQEAKHKYYRMAIGGVTTTGLVNHVHRTWRYMTADNQRAGTRALRWEVTQHTDLPLMLMRHEVDGSYPTQFTLTDHVDTGEIMMADGIFAAAAKSFSDVGTQNLPATLAAGLLSSDDPDPADGLDDSSDEDEEVGLVATCVEPSALEAEQKLHKKIAAACKSGQYHSLVGDRAAVRAAVTLPVKTSVDAAVYIYVMSHQSCQGSAKVALATLFYNECVAALQRHGVHGASMKTQSQIKAYSALTTQRLAGCFSLFSNADIYKACSLTYTQPSVHRCRLPPCRCLSQGEQPH
jgi:hypothetical protein